MTLPHSTDHHTGYGTAVSRWAGVGPYYAMFPVRFATEAIRTYTEPGDHVLDPFAGRATSLFAASTEGRVGVGMEINPVGWVYGKAKLQTADHEDVQRRLRSLGRKAKDYREPAKALPEFFRRCYCPAVLEFLLAARANLNWRRNKIDWTTMALLLVDLHGKREVALSNQMRQTKSMSPPYAVAWWKEHRLEPPEREPVAWMLKKVAWRYAKGKPESGESRVYLGDCRETMRQLGLGRPRNQASLLLTSPPYWSVTNYFYDQWLRLWLLGGPPAPRGLGSGCRSRFADRRAYVDLLRGVFAGAALFLKKNAVIHVRTDARAFTQESTIQALEQTFPRKKLRQQRHSLPGFCQTTLFDSEYSTTGEVDLVMW